MKNVSLLLVLFCVVSVMVPDVALGEEIVVVLSDMGYLPFYTKDASEGIYVEFMTEFEKRNPEFEIVFKVVPRKRMDAMMENGTAQAFSITNPLFVGEKASDFVFSVPFWSEAGVVLMNKKNAFPYTGPEDLFGKTLGIIHGNQYPAFQEYFDSGQIKTFSGEKYLQLAKLLQQGRIDAFLGDKTPALYEIKVNGLNPSDFVFSDATFFELDFMTQIQKTHQHFLEKLNAFIEQSKENGFLQELEEKYLR